MATGSDVSHIPRHRARLRRGTKGEFPAGSSSPHTIGTQRRRARPLGCMAEAAKMAPNRSRPWRRCGSPRAANQEGVIEASHKGPFFAASATRLSRTETESPGLQCRRRLPQTTLGQSIPPNPDRQPVQGCSRRIRRDPLYRASRGCRPGGTGGCARRATCTLWRRCRPAIRPCADRATMPTLSGSSPKPPMFRTGKRSILRSPWATRSTAMCRHITTSCRSIGDWKRTIGLCPATANTMFAGTIVQTVPMYLGMDRGIVRSPKTVSGSSRSTATTCRYMPQPRTHHALKKPKRCSMRRSRPKP